MLTGPNFKRSTFIVLILALIVVSTLSYIVYAKNRSYIHNPFTKISTPVTPAVPNLNDIRSQITTQVKQCITEKIGTDQTRIVTDGAKQLQEIPPKVLVAVYSCLPSNFPAEKVDITPDPNIKVRQST